jgi:RNA polymerase sigma factor (sigma-70 family)
MMTTQTMSATANRDAQLVEWSLTGDRDAFRQIVERYQSLVCSITYNATGSLTLSEDLAQETFVAAWKQLSELREPEHLRAWLCGITRFLVGKELRRQGREPIHAAAPLEAIHEPSSREPSPAAQAVSREEEAILWRALERIPDAYREPLILFYREQQSVERVADELELSEDAVKQRLSRGRKLLQEEVIAFVEGTLTRTAPGQEFSGAVLAALPLVAASAATAGAGAAAKGAGATKFGFLGALLAPFIGIIGGMTASWMSVRAASSERERRVKKLGFIAIWGFVFGWCFIAQPAVKALSRYYQWSEPALVGALVGFWWFYAATAALLFVVLFRRVLAIRQQFEATGGISQVPALLPTAHNRLALVIAIHLAFFWVAYLAWSAGDRVWAAGIAAALILLGGRHLYRLRGKTGSASMRATFGHMAVVFGLMLVVLNLRLDVWLAARRGVSLGDFHELMPIWVMPLFTAALIAWVATLLAITRPKPAPVSDR